MIKAKSVNKRASGFDFSLLFVVIFLCVFGLIMIYSSSYYTAAIKENDGAYYLKRQMLFYGIGLAVMLVTAFIPHRFYPWLAPLSYVPALICIILTDVSPRFQIKVNGQPRWFRVDRAGKISFQPAEVVKVAVILTAAVLINYAGREIDRWIRILPILIATAFIDVFVVIHNLSSGFIIMAIPVVMILMVSRNKWLKIIFWFLLALAIGAILFIRLTSMDELMDIGKDVVEKGFLEEYQVKRIYVWKDPLYDAQDSGYQVVQGLYAIGSGGVFGKGLGASTQKLGFVPEASNDMIFAILCEELGLFGAISLIVLYLFLLYRMLLIANRARDMFSYMVVVGVMAHIALQVVLHVAVVTNVIPNTGVTLPFISYGGTSSLFMMAEIGLVFGIGRRYPETEGDEEAAARL